MLEITKLTCEYQSAPLGLDELYPRFGWQLRSDKRGVMQTAYHIQVALDNTFSALVWDSGSVKSDASTHVTYNGSALRCCTRYFYRIAAWDNYGECTGWSDIAWWETGLLSSNGWCAEWIGCTGEQEEKLEASPLYRKMFRIDKQIVSARVYVSALGLYELHLNGKRVGDWLFTPGWTSYGERIQYQTYDVTSFLKHGDNTIGAILGNGWYAGYIAYTGEKAFYGDRRGLILQMHIKYTDGTERVVRTDDTWKTSFGPIQMSEIYHGETYDARLEKNGWDESEYRDDGWSNAIVLNHSKEILVAQQCQPVRVVRELPVLRTQLAPNGEVILDFGQNLTGFVRMKVKGKRGDCVTIRHGEELKENGDLYTENLRTARQTTTYYLKGTGVEVYTPHFSFQGFRYIAVSGYPGTIGPENFVACVVTSDLPITGEFKCSDEMVNQLQHNIQWSQIDNFLDVPTDCPQRSERHGWTGDAQMFARTACFNEDIVLFYAKWLADLAGDQNKIDGVPYDVPSVRDPRAHSSAAWGDAVTICPWTMYLCYGDTRLLQRQFKSMKKWIDYIRRQGDNPYLWNTGFHFGDWLALDNEIDTPIGRTSREFIATAYYALSTRIAMQTAAVLGEQKDEVELAQLYSEIIRNFHQEFVTPNGRLTENTQTGYALALKFQLLSEKERKRAIDGLVKLLQESNFHLRTGFVGTPYLCHALSENGYTDIAYQLLLQTDYPSWLYPITKGATTIWEHWDGIREDGTFRPANSNSFNHYAYGAVGEWLYSVVAGLNIDPEKPGYKHILIKPQPNERMSYAFARYQSQYGEIISAWERNGKKMTVQCKIPVNTTATVTLPKAEVSMVSETNNNLITQLRTEMQQIADGVRLELGSGEYIFEYSYKEN